MKKQIHIIEKTTRAIEVEVPSYFRQHGMYYAISDNSVITAAGTFTSFTASSDTDRYNNAVNEVLKYGPLPISQQEFDTAFNNTIKCLTEQYQLSMSMILDPNTQPAEGQQAEETAALESASQDNAMEATESTEEGGTEG